jgi:hypothetical protein
MSGLGDLIIRLLADTTDFESGMTRSAHVSEREMRKIEANAAKLGAAFAAAATVATGAMVLMTKSAIDAADEIGKMSQRIGMSVESLSALQYSAKLSDVSMSALEQTLKHLSTSMLSTQAGTGAAQAAFRALGVSVEASKGSLKSNQEVMAELADKFAAMEDGAGKTALAMRIFGKSGAELIPLLNQGAAGLRENADEARRFGIIISTETAVSAEKLKDNITRLTEASRALGLGIANFSLPWLNKMVEQLVEGERIAGSFGKALSLFGMSTIGSGNAGAKIQELGAQLTELQSKRERMVEQGRTGWLPEIDQEIEDTRKRLEFAKLLQRQVALELGAGVGRDERARFGGGGKTPAPVLPDLTQLAKANDRAMADARLLAEGEQQFARDATEAWSLFAESRARQIAEESALQADKMQAWYRMIDAGDEQLFKQSEYIAVNSKSMTQLAIEAADTQAKAGEKAARELGLVFVSAAEDSLRHWQGVGKLLKSIGADIAQIIFRKSVTERLGASITKGVGSLDLGTLFQGTQAPAPVGDAIALAPLPSFDVGTDYVPHDMIAKVHRGEKIVPAAENAAGGRVVNHFAVDMRGATVEAVARLERLVMQVNGSLERRAVAAVSGAQARGVLP